MNTKTKLIRFVFTLFLVTATLGISATTVLADQPVMYKIGPLTEDSVLLNTCEFPVSISVTFTITGTDFVDKNGIVKMTHWHFDAQDTFTANGKTLIGVPYTYNVEVYWDSDGNATSWYVNGVIEKVPLPDKTLFNPAGRSNITENPFEISISPDKGTSGNVDGFCAALSE